MDALDALTYDPIPGPIQQRVRTLTRDLHLARQYAADGRLSPKDYAIMEKILATRMKLLEAEVHTRLLQEARSSSTMPYHGARAN